jgi:putative ABC transport system permease protein
MHTLKYIWRNVMRHKLRTSLTVMSVAFSLAFMTVLQGFMVMQNAWAKSANKNRVVVMNVQGFSGKLPISHVDKIRKLENVVDAVPYQWYGGNYGEEKPTLFSQFGTDAEHVFAVWNEFIVDPAQVEAWKKDKQGCMVDQDLAERRQWQIGDKLPLKGTFYPFDLELRISGFFKNPEGPTDSVMFHWKYLDEGLRNANFRGNGSAGTIFARTTSAGDMPLVMEEIDKVFVSSEYPTRSQTEGAFAQMFTDMMGNMKMFVLIIGVAVVFSLSLVTATGMAMSMRERTTEVAVLKAIGFKQGRILRMVLGESFFIALLGGILGVASGCAMIQGIHLTNRMVFPISITQFAGPWMFTMIGVAGVVGLVSGIVPAMRAANSSVIDGLRRVV